MEEHAARRRQARKLHNEQFFERLQKRGRDAKAVYEKAEKKINVERAARMAARGPAAARGLEEAARLEGGTVRELVLETIVSEERPVLFVQDDWINKIEVTVVGDEARELIGLLDGQREKLSPFMPLIGRIDVSNFPGNDFLGTGWFVTPDIVVTNRHVASLVARWDGRRFVFRRGIAGRDFASSVCTAHEFDDLVPDQARVFAVKEVLYIEPESSRHDIAFLRVQRRTGGNRPDFIPIASTDVRPDAPVVVVGYPARAPKSVIPDQEMMKRLYRERYDVKRAAPGLTMPAENGTTRHDCTTLGGNSGSVVLDLRTGEAVGLHFAGLYEESNYAVRASVLADYVKRKRWLEAPLAGIRPPAETPLAPPMPSAAGGIAAAVLAGPGGSATLSIPLQITVRLGTALPDPANVTSRGGSVSVEAAEAAAMQFWDQRPDGVIAVRVGFGEDGDTIGDRPLIAASVTSGRLARVQAAGPSHFQMLEVRYFPADVDEEIENLPIVESVDSIAYDDDARTGEGFSFGRVHEAMTVRAHVGPEYSWDELKRFLGGANRSLVSAIYEFHGPHIADAIEERLAQGASLELVMDNTTFSKVKDAEEEFDRVERFRAWADRFGSKFKRIVAPEGTSGLISDAYHIKVTVREDDSFWLSSGNWKLGSSQPKVTQAQRDNAADTDLPGNREWHVVVTNKTLADRFRNHIRQDFKRAKDLGGGVLPESREAVEIFVDVPVEPVLERPPPSRVVEPQDFTGPIQVRPLLTPDKEGAVYSEAVLELIESARESLLFQIPYISMPSNPRADRGFLDALIKALTHKLKTLDDARLILRTGGSRYSQPTHAAWFFKSKGVDIKSRVRRIQDHHTKGMIVDGKRVLIGSHNWSKPGVTLNRDASLIFDHEGLAGYYAEAFEIDWARAKPMKPKKFEPEGVVLEAVGDQPPPGYRRVRLSDLLKEED